MEVDEDRNRELETSKKIEEMEIRGAELIRVKPSSSSGRKKLEERIHLFQEVGEGVERKTLEENTGGGE